MCKESGNLNGIKGISDCCGGCNAYLCSNGYVSKKYLDKLHYGIYDSQWQYGIFITA